MSSPRACLPIYMALLCACSNFKASEVAADAALDASGGVSTHADDAGGSASGNDAGLASDGAARADAQGTTGATDGSSPDGETTSFGAGPYGVLPSGYCCTSDHDCRNRRCIAFGGSNMCADTCLPSRSDACQGLTDGLHCVADDAGNTGHCEPIEASTACLPADQFAHGDRPLGACCDPRSDTRDGVQCLGGHCESFGDGNPYICTTPCNGPSDCPGSSYDCIGAYDYGLCAPLASSYTCSGT